jgi:protein-tyrosine phosphatase
MNHIKPHKLWIGHIGDSFDYQKMFSLKIGALVTLAAEEVNGQVPRDLIYCHFPIVDGAENEEQILEVAIQTLAKLLAKTLPTLVCCSAGLSRSPSVAAAALSIVQNQPVDRCLEDLASFHRTDVSPGLWMQIKHVVEKMSSKGGCHETI